MTVLLQILRVLGILLLILLGLFLLALLIVLFMPVVYRGEGYIRPREKSFRFRARWLFGLVRAEFSYPETNALRVKLFLKTLVEIGGRKAAGTSEEAAGEAQPSEKPSGEEPAGEAQPLEESSGEPRPSEGAAGEQKTSDEPSEEPQSPAKSSEEPRPSEGAAGEQKTSDGPSGEPQPSEKPSNESDSGADGKSGAESEEKGPASGPLRKIEKTAEALEDTLENVRYYLDLLQDNDTRILLGNGLGRLLRILKGILPGKLSLTLQFGTGAPDTTGYLYGLYCMLLPALGKNTRVTPCFEEKCLEGELSFGGHVTGWVLVYHILAVLLDKRLRPLIHKLKHGRKK